MSLCRDRDAMAQARWLAKKSFVEGTTGVDWSSLEASALLLLSSAAKKSSCFREAVGFSEKFGSKEFQPDHLCVHFFLCFWDELGQLSKQH